MYHFPKYRVRLPETHIFFWCIKHVKGIFTCDIQVFLHMLHDYDDSNGAQKLQFESTGL